MTRWDLFAVGKEKKKKNPAGYRFEDEERSDRLTRAGDSDPRLRARPARLTSGAGAQISDSCCLFGCCVERSRLRGLQASRPCPFVPVRHVRPDGTDTGWLRPDFLPACFCHTAKLLFDLRRK